MLNILKVRITSSVLITVNSGKILKLFAQSDQPPDVVPTTVYQDDKIPLILPKALSC